MGRRRTHDLFKAFNRWCYDAHGYSASTRYQYYLAILRADGWLLENRGVSLPFADLKDLQAFMFSLPPSASTRNGVRRALCSAFAFFVERNLCKHNIARQLPRLPESKSLPKALTEQIAEKLVAGADAMEPMARAAIYVLMYAALRRNEVTHLEWRFIDTEYIRFKGKGNKDREVPIHVDLRAALSVWRQRCPSARWVFPSPVNVDRPVSHTWLASRVRELGESIGLPRLTPHVFRHTTATILLDKTEDITVVQEFLGHEKVSTTTIYAKVKPRRVVEGVGKLNFKPRPSEGEQ